MSEKIVRIVLRMYENVQHSVETDQYKRRKIVRIVRKTYENVVRYVETEQYKRQKIVRIVQQMLNCVKVIHVEMERQM